MIEDDLRATMRAHENEAPTAAEFTPAVRARRALVPVLVLTMVATVALAVAAVALASRDRVTNRPADTVSCPAVLPASTTSTAGVPSLPRGVDGHSRLAPDRTPTSVVICKFAAPASGGHLTGTRTLAESFHAVQETLTWAPRAVGPYYCTGVGRSESQLQPQFLVGVTYADTSMWVSAPAGCPLRPSTNGQFNSAVDLVSYARAAYSTGTWPTTPSHAGRLGQDTSMVPGSPTSLTLHRFSDHRTKTVTTGFAGLVDALNNAPTTPSRYSCGPSGPQLYSLTFHYAQGPDVVVQLSKGCFPEIDNGSLQIRDGSKFSTAILALLR